MRKFKFEDTELRLLIQLTISGNREYSEWTFKCLSVYSHDYSLDLDEINLFEKSTKLLGY